jgi:hypothetical protein
MTKYNWSIVDPYWRFIARDQDGQLIAYRVSPTLDQGVWVPQTLKDDLRGISDFKVLGQLPEELDTDTLGDWQNSLEMRPKPEPRYTFGLDESGKEIMVHDHVMERLLSYVEAVKVLNEYEETTHD